MQRAPIPAFYLLSLSLLLTFATAACGKKPDGTPYGVDPAKLPEGRRKTAGTTPQKQAVPSGARAGQPAHAAPAAPAR